MWLVGVLKNMFKKMSVLILTFFPLLSFSNVPYQDDTLERSYLVEIINQIESMKSLIHLADQAQIKQADQIIHYHRYRDNRGQIHAGVLDDLNAIEAGIQERLTKTPPLRFYQPIEGDYLERVRG